MGWLIMSHLLAFSQSRGPLTSSRTGVWKMYNSYNTFLHPPVRMSSKHGYMYNESFPAEAVQRLEANLQDIEGKLELVRGTIHKI